MKPNLLTFSTSFLYEKWSKRPLDLSDEVDIHGKLILITGGDGGLGQATIAELADRGGKIIMGCLDLADGQKAVEEVRKKTPRGEMYVHQLDLSDLSSVRSFACEVKASYPHLNVLINNAGVAYTSQKLKLTKEGFEAHMGINCLGHILLTQLLIDHLKKGSPSRIIFIASTMHLAAKLDLDDLMLEKTPVDLFGFIPYSNSKLAMMLYSQELAGILKNSGITTYSVCPGLVGKTGIFDQCSKFAHFYTKIFIFCGGHSPKEGCKTAVFCATSKKCSNESGRMYRFNREWVEATKNVGKMSELSERFYKISLRLVGLETET